MTAPLRRLLGLVLILGLLARRAQSGFWSSSRENDDGGSGAAAAAVAGSVEAEVGAGGDVSAGGKGDEVPKCKPVLRELPGKYLGPLGDQSLSKSNGASSMMVFITNPGSPWWCGEGSSPTVSAKKSRALRSQYGAGVYLASVKSKGVRAAFGITGKSQVPAVAVVEMSTGRRYVLRSGEVPSELPSQKDGGLDAASVDQIMSVFAKPKPLDIFDVSWFAARSAGAHSIEEEEDVRLVMVMVKSSSNAKKIVKGGLRRIAQARRGRARVVLSRDRDTWMRFGLDESRLPSIVTFDPNRDSVKHYGQVKAAGVARAVENIIDSIVSKKTHTPSASLNNPARNYSGGFHRVSWSPHLYIMDGFLSPTECESMIKNAYPTLSTGSLVGDNINKKIKDLRFTVVPEDRFTRVEHDVVNRIHDHVRISEPHGEILQVSEYLPGQKYTLHPDSIGSSPGPHSMQRIMTVLIYLNDVEDGGHTVFPRANGQNQHITRHDTEPWNLEYICNLEDTFKVAPKAGRAIFWYNHHTDLSWDQNTIHGACHVTKGIKYVAQRWIRWHTTATDGHNPLQRALDENWQLGRQLDEARRIAKSSGAGETKALMNKVQSYQAEIDKLRRQLNEKENEASDLQQRIGDLGDVVPISIKPASMAAAWRVWVLQGSMLVPVLENLNGNNALDRVCLLMGRSGCTEPAKALFADMSSPILVKDLQESWAKGFSKTYRWTVSRSPYGRLMAFYDRIMVEADIKSDIDRTWQKRLKKLGSFHEFIVGPIRMYHFSMTPTAGGDIGRHPGTRSQVYHLGRNPLKNINYVARYEHLMRDLQDLCARKGSVFEKGCVSRLSNKLGDGKQAEGEKHSHLIEYFDSQRVNLWEIVNEAFAEDFNVLGYPKVTSTAEYREKYMPLSIDALVSSESRALP